MKTVLDRVVQYSNRYQLINVDTQQVLGTFDFNEVTGTIHQVGTEIDAELFQSIADDLAQRVKYSDKFMEIDSGSHTPSSSLLVGGIFLLVI